jgi:hypothetical protein
LSKINWWRCIVRRWSTVFPVGLYAACSFVVGTVAGVPAVTDFAKVWVWVALAVWLVVAGAMLRRAPGLVRGAAPLPGASGLRCRNACLWRVIVVQCFYTSILEKRTEVMTTATLPRSRPQRRRDVHRRQPPASAAPATASASALPLPAELPGGEAMPPINPRHHGGTVVFEIGFDSGMTGSELELLRRQLAMTTHVEHKLSVDPNSPAHAQLDRESSLLLEPGLAPDRWVLQARTWGSPSPRTVHDWQVRVAQVAQRLDRKVAVPTSVPGAPYGGPLRPVGRAANRRFAAARRRLMGLPTA